MDGLWLTPEQARQIARHALDETPREACGLIGGVGSRAVQVIATPNVADQPETRYEVDPAALVQALAVFQASGLDLIGFYHSHPKDPPAPSASDIALAYYPNNAYVIVSLRSGEPELAAWQIAQGSAERVPLHLDGVPPPDDNAPMTSSQKVAIIVSALLAVAAFLAIALSLLPPAPRIP